MLSFSFETVIGESILLNTLSIPPSGARELIINDDLYIPTEMTNVPNELSLLDI